MVKKKGRPRLEPDAEKPWRRESVLTSARQIGEPRKDDGDSRPSEEPIIVSSEPAAGENKTSPITPEKAPEESAYICGDCEAPLSRNDRNCSGCGAEKNWDNVQ